VQVNAAFVANQRCYGSRRIVDELKEQRINIGRYKVRRLMREAGLKPVWTNAGLINGICYLFNEVGLA